MQMTGFFAVLGEASTDDGMTAFCLNESQSAERLRYVSRSA